MGHQGMLCFLNLMSVQLVLDGCFVDGERRRGGDGWIGRGRASDEERRAGPIAAATSSTHRGVGGTVCVCVWGLKRGEVIALEPEDSGSQPQCLYLSRTDTYDPMT